MMRFHLGSADKPRALPPAQERSGGFSLIEIAIVMTIMGTLLAGGLALMGGIQATNQVKVTTTRLDSIEQALALFARRNGRLPCPANGAIADDGANRGTADPQGATNTCNSMAAGIVPWIDLGLPAETALDGWKRRFSYYVFDGAGTGLTRANGVDGSNPTGRGLDIQDEMGQLVANSALTTGAAYVLISHGRDGWGSYLPSGNQMPPDATHVLEVDNTDGNPYRTAPTSDVDDATHFDDIVRWATIDGLATSAGFLP